MEKPPMCRICLVVNVRILVLNKNLQEIYEKLTDIPFKTEDRKPILACFFCCAKLKQCYRLRSQCLEAEKLFAQMINETSPLINKDHLKYFSGFIISPTENISIVDECQTESIYIKEELPAVCERLDDVIEPKEEHQSDELEPENVDNSLYVIRPHHSEVFEEDVPLMEFKTEVKEEPAVAKNKQRAREPTRANVAKKTKLDTRRTQLEDAITAEQTSQEKSDSKVIRMTQKRTSKPNTYFKKPYKCNVCQRSFGKNSKLKNHIRKHTGEKPYECDVCQRSFTEKRYLTSHKRIHTGDKPYKCHLCQRSFIEKSALTKHIRIHTGEKPFKCDMCQCSFRHNVTLKNHIRQHTGEKPYKCDVCQRNFSKKGVLTNHIRTHTGEKPFKCDICQSNFRQKFALKIHTRQHTGEKPYKCDVCQRNFVKKAALTNHIRTHTGEKPFKCDTCQCSFRSSSNLKSHIQRTHTAKNPSKCVTTFESQTMVGLKVEGQDVEVVFAPKTIRF